MKTCNDNHLQMANQESNIDRGGDKMSLFKTFNFKRLKKSCSLFLSSIVTLSILSVANSSLAFPALIHKTQFNNSGKTITLPFKPFSILEIEYCKTNMLCKASGYFQQQTFSQYPNGGKSLSLWVPMWTLCNNPYDFHSDIPYLIPCVARSKRYNLNNSNQYIPFDQEETWKIVNSEQHKEIFRNVYKNHCKRFTDSIEETYQAGLLPKQVASNIIKIFYSNSVCKK